VSKEHGKDRTKRNSVMAAKETRAKDAFWYAGTAEAVGISIA
jgi:hypothetical protein